jgi:3-oxoacyl-[acyl-carrier-protein] synthase-1
MNAAIIGIGASTPLGLTATQTAFLLRTGMPGVGPCALVDAQGEPVTFGLQSTLDPRLVGPARAERLIASPIAEALLPVREVAADLRASFVLALDEGLRAEERWGAVDPAADLVRAITERTREILPRVQISPVARGGGGPGFVLRDAIAAVDHGSSDLLLFGGVHTDYEPARIRALEERGRLFTPSNLDAQIPGEAAAVLAIARPDVARRLGAPILARIIAVSAGFEEANPDNDRSAYEAKGLTTTIRALGQALGGARAGWMLTDLTFEMWRVLEWQAMITRTREVWTEPYAVESPGQRVGAIGAAALPLLASFVAEGFRRGFAPSPIAIAFAGSDGGERSALAITTPG